MTKSRRQFFGGSLLILGAYAAFSRGLPTIRALATNLEFTPLDQPEGFRRMAGGPTSTSAFDPFVGLDDSTDRISNYVTANLQNDLCSTLFAAWSGEPAVVPIAFFSDYNCPICRVTNRRLSESRQVLDGSAIVTWHELPIFGETSMQAARAALAAGRQGSYEEFHRRLLRTPFQPSPSYLDALAKDIGLDRERLIADIQSEEVAKQIDQSFALRDIFGFIGTPSLVIGRTVIQGDIDDATLSKLIDVERSEGPVLNCRAQAALSGVGKPPY